MPNHAKQPPLARKPIFWAVAIAVLLAALAVGLVAFRPFAAGESAVEATGEAAAEAVGEAASPDGGGNESDISALSVSDEEDQAVAQAARESDEPSIIEADDGTQYAAGEALLEIDGSLDEEGLRGVLDQAGYQTESVELVSDALDDGNLLVLVELAGGEDPATACDALQDLSGIVSAEPNYVYQLADVEEDALSSTDTLSGDPDESEQWEHDAIGLDEAWEASRCEGSVTVAVIDSGVDCDHEDLADNLILGNYAKNTYTNMTGATAVEDSVGHGTHVAGIIAAVADNATGIAGSSYNANILPIKATNERGELYLNDLVEAMDYVVSLKTAASSPDELKALRVINMSLGGTSHSRSYDAAVQRARDAGILIVAAAGNSSSNEEFYPAACEGVVGVAALAQSSSSAGVEAASYSNYGDYVDIAAPGSDIYSTYLGGQYKTLSGTSMAAPVVSSVAALAFAADSSADPDEVEAALTETALDLGDEGCDDVYGAGMVQAADAISQVAPADSQEPDSTAAQAMYRLYNPNSGEHFYTAASAERDYLDSIGWNYEGIGWTAPSSSSVPVYRLYNSSPSPTTGSGEHHYTMSEAERDSLVEEGWSYEGIGWYSDDDEAVPVYRQYNPNEFNNNHNYTVSVIERNCLLSLGWKDEGVAWYGVA